jgi:hypothetical protein
MQIPDDIETTVPYCPTCGKKGFRLTATDTVCTHCGQLFPHDHVPFRDMQKDEPPARVKRLDGSSINIPEPLPGEYDPEMDAYWDSCTCHWIQFHTMTSVEVPASESFRYLARKENHE